MKNRSFYFALHILDKQLKQMVGKPNVDYIAGYRAARDRLQQEIKNPTYERRTKAKL